MSLFNFLATIERNCLLLVGTRATDEHNCLLLEGVQAREKYEQLGRKLRGVNRDNQISLTRQPTDPQQKIHNSLISVAFCYVKRPQCTNLHS